MLIRISDVSKNYDALELDMEYTGSQEPRLDSRQSLVVVFASVVTVTVGILKNL